MKTALRQEFLENQGLKVYRIADSDVKNNLGIVMKELEDYVVRDMGNKPPRPSDTPPREGN